MTFDLDWIILLIKSLTGKIKVNVGKTKSHPGRLLVLSQQVEKQEKGVKYFLN